MQLIEIIVAILAAALVLFTLVWNLKRFKSKDKSCGCGGCGGCGAGRGGCHTKH